MVVLGLESAVQSGGTMGHGRIKEGHMENFCVIDMFIILTVVMSL